MDGNRFDDLARQLAVPRSRRSVLGLLAGIAAGLAGTSTVGADPKPDKPSKCYGEGSSCTNAKQCCSGICTNRRCAAPVPQCGAPSDCPGTDTECSFRTCIDGTCGFGFVPAGTLTGQQTTGDCLQNVCDGAGGVGSIVDDSDIPDDGNPCTIEACNGGTSSSTPAAAGTACGDDGDMFCDGSGQCVECLTPTDCSGQDTACQQRTCTNGQCGVFNVPDGTILSQQTEGDCRIAACDGAGGEGWIVDPTDVPPDDGNPCTIEVCHHDNPSHDPAAPGTLCGNDGVCNGAGGCGVCIPNSTLPCYSGPAGTAGVGICRMGTKTCATDGSGYGPCLGEITPRPEICNGLDDDCSGVPDNGAVCPSVQNGNFTCIGGQCVLAGCVSGYGNCNGIPADGCETRLFDDPYNCGACGNVCPQLSVCQGAQCCTPNGYSPTDTSLPCCPGTQWNQSLDMCI